MKSNKSSFGSGVLASKYSASQVEQNREAYRQDGRVRTGLPPRSRPRLWAEGKGESTNRRDFFLGAI